MKKIFSLLLLFSCLILAEGPRVLLVTAHPDDETGAAITIYRITHDLKGTVDLFLVTNGEGGYKYSTLAEAYYGLPLTDEQSGRKFLPSIRKTELMNGGKIMGIHNYYFMDQKDTRYTLDKNDVTHGAWNITMIKARLAELIGTNHYDFVFCLLPVPETHGHHKMASLLALEAVKNCPESSRPVILGYSVSSKPDTSRFTYTGLPDEPNTQITGAPRVYHTDRTIPFGFKNKLNYKVIANWVIAEHKSQGTMQLYMNGGDVEDFYLFDINAASAHKKAEQLFSNFITAPYPVKEYNEQ
ncbi:MAG: PIG-L family deacetylase [Ignavibacteria bacterium]|nr:PIG-L family deacetylase [Ignavibacteria bacterium]